MADYTEAEAIPEVDDNSSEHGGAIGAEEQEDQNVEQSESQESEEGEQQPAAEEVWDGTKFTLKFRDREIVPESRQKLINLAQLGYSYSNKANDFKARQQQLQQQEQELARYKKMVNAIQSNPQFQQQLFDMYNQYSQNGVTQGEANGRAQVPPEIQERLDELTQFKTQFEERQADQELQGEIDKLKQSHSSDDWETPDTNGRTLTWQVLNHAYQNNFPTLESAYRDLMFDKVATSTKATTLQQQAARRQADKRAGKVTSGAPVTKGAQKPKGPNIRNMNYDQIAQHIISEG